MFSQHSVLNLIVQVSLLKSKSDDYALLLTSSCGFSSINTKTVLMIAQQPMWSGPLGLRTLSPLLVLTPFTLKMSGACFCPKARAPACSPLPGTSSPLASLLLLKSPLNATCPYWLHTEKQHLPQNLQSHPNLLTHKHVLVFHIMIVSLLQLRLISLICCLISAESSMPRFMP